MHEKAETSRITCIFKYFKSIKPEALHFMKYKIIKPA